MTPTAARTRWMLDTNIVSSAIRNPHGLLAKRIQQISAETPEQICTSLMVACELQFGVQKLGSASLAAKVETMLQFVRPLDMDASLVQPYAMLRTQLAAVGTPIGPNDTLIAAHALALDCTLVTDNDAEFSRVQGLRVENWLR